MSLERTLPAHTVGPVEHHRYGMVDVSVRTVSANSPAHRYGWLGGTVLVPGWSMPASSRAPIPLAAALAHYSGQPTHIISAQHRDNDLHTISEESTAVARYIKEAEIHAPMLTGHSRGGAIAMDTALELQAHDTYMPSGLILLDSARLYEQPVGALARGFLRDTFVASPLMMTEIVKTHPTIVRLGVKASMEVTKQVMLDMVRAPLSYPGRTLHQLREMATVYPHLGELSAPVVIISGSHDPISDPSKIDTTIFSGSPSVRMLKGDKLGGHGLPLVRAEQVARTALYSLHRHYRNM